MPRTGAKGGFGTTFFMDSGDGAGFTEIAEVGDIQGLDMENEFDDATNMKSPSGFSEAIATGTTTVSDLTLPVALLENDAAQTRLESAMLSRALCNFRLVYPSGLRRRAFAGFVKSMAEAMPVKGKMTKSIVLKVTGPLARENNP
ncbi:MAG: phage tail tube protein [Phycisphaerales bacterium]